MIPDFSRPVVLFGGSFDPVHNGHGLLAMMVIAQLPGAQVALVPAAQSPGKAPPFAPKELRLKWLELMAQAFNQAAKAGIGAREDCTIVWDAEIRRGGTSFTVDTLQEAHALGATRDKLFLLLGADSYASLSSWREPERIRTLCRILVAKRPGVQLALKEGTDDLILEAPEHPASSTAIREALEAGRPLGGLLPAAVESELRELSLKSQNPYVRKKHD